jgi:hypothetical protein
MWRVWGRKEGCTGCWWGNLRERGRLGRPRRRWEDNIKMDVEEVGGVVGTGWSWLRIGTGFSVSVCSSSVTIFFMFSIVPK